MTEKKLLMIPGPIESDPAVMQEMGSPTLSHVDPDFIETFGEALELMRQVWQCPSGQPVVVAGSGTLAMDMAASNLVEPGDNVLVISTGYFGERFADLLDRLGANVTIVRSPLGSVVTPDQLEKEFDRGSYKLVTMTHVDTSTAVRMDPQPIAEMAANRGALTVLDGVCSVAGEDMRQEDWGIDVVLTASQKALGVPPGLALMMISPKALDEWNRRKSPVRNYYADWGNWLPIMKAYAGRKPSYFGTPPVNLITALRTSLRIILKEGMPARVERHRKIGRAFRSAMKALGLEMIPENETVAANTLSATYFPDGYDGSMLLAEARRAGVILAGGLLKDMKRGYFRIGHMGSVSSEDVFTTVGAIETALRKGGYDIDLGSGVCEAKKILAE